VILYVNNIFFGRFIILSSSLSLSFLFNVFIYLLLLLVFIYLLVVVVFFPSSSLLLLIFEISNLMLSDWISFLAYPNLFGIKGFVVVYPEGKMSQHFASQKPGDVVEVKG
jgi:hypothetical protein